MCDGSLVHELYELDVRVWNDDGWKLCEKDIWQGRMWIDLLKWMKIVKILVS